MEDIESLDCLEQRLRTMISQNQFLTDVLMQLRAFEPLAYLSAGVIRNWVWSHLHGQDYDFHQTEIDVIFYYADEINQKRTLRLQSFLQGKYPHQIWDVTNQAHVHHWYKTEYGDSIPALQSINEALSYWPETATAIAVRMNQQQDLEVIAPFGLTDLFELKLRWNSRLVSRGVFLKRVHSKDFLARWPRLTMIS